MKDVKKAEATLVGRPVAVVKGVMRAIIYVLYTRLVKGQVGKKRLSAPKALEVIEWIIGLDRQKSRAF